MSTKTILGKHRAGNNMYAVRQKKIQFIRTIGVKKIIGRHHIIVLHVIIAYSY